MEIFFQQTAIRLNNRRLSNFMVNLFKPKQLIAKPLQLNLIKDYFAIIKREKEKDNS